MFHFVCFCAWCALSARTGSAQVASDGAKGPSIVETGVAKRPQVCLMQTKSAMSVDGDDDAEPHGEPAEEAEANQPYVNPFHPDDFEPDEHGYSAKSENDIAGDEAGESQLLQQDSDCSDNPRGWYDIDGDRYHCGWYAVGDRCRSYGAGYARLGKTANDACCACGGGGAGYAPGPIKSKHNSQCLDMALDGSNNVYLHPCHSGDNQIWYFQDGHIKTLQYGKNWCLDQDMGGSKNLYMHPCHDGWNQKFHHSGDAIFIANPQDERQSLDMDMGGSRNLYIHPWHGGANQRWHIGGAITVNGRWQARGYVATGGTKYTAKHGSVKTSSTTRSEEWSTSVGAEVSAGGTFMGIGLSATLSTEIGHSLSMAHSTEFSMSTEETYEHSFNYVPNQQIYLWQWGYDTDTDGAERVTTKTISFAVTAGLYQRPRCVPGYCTDHPICQQCSHPGSISY